jgi:aminocarboxymuconate-semialdehyde decarboxylase
VDLALQELKRVVSDYGFKGVQVGSNIDGKNLGDDSLFPFWEQVRERDLFVFSHGLSPLGPERMAEHELKNFVGLPIDTAVTVGSMVFGGVYERLPGLKVCYSHGGGAFPCLVGRWDHGYRGRLSKQADTTIKMPSDYLKDIYADSLTHDPAGVRYLVERLGEDQVLLGSDHPFDMGEADPIGKVRSAIEDQAVVDKIVGGTAAKLLNL